MQIAEVLGPIALGIDMLCGCLELPNDMELETWEGSMPGNKTGAETGVTFVAADIT